MATKKLRIVGSTKAHAPHRDNATFIERVREVISVMRAGQDAAKLPSENQKKDQPSS